MDATANDADDDSEVDDMFVDAGEITIESGDNIFGGNTVDDADDVDDTVDVTDDIELCNVVTVATERRGIDIDEDAKVDAFLNKGCGCTYFNGKQCSTAFTRQHICSICDQCSSFDRPTLQNILFGHVMAMVRTSETIESRGHPFKREKETDQVFYMKASWYNNIILLLVLPIALQVCKTTFLFLHNIGVKKLQYCQAGVLEKWAAVNYTWKQVPSPSTWFHY